VRGEFTSVGRDFFGPMGRKYLGPSAEFMPFIVAQQENQLPDPTIAAIEGAMMYSRPIAGRPMW